MWVHMAVVRRLEGDGAFGPQFSAPIGEPCLVSNGSKLVRGPDGAEVVSTASVAFPPTVALVPVGSEVLLPAEFGGRTALVLATNIGDGGGLPTPDNQTVNLE
ncbi:hypothetical protein O4215_20685 [Rhodococcus maanshanensis]|uniref:hypothetical protein n=1 Tax=Rhodococcus maanshanensis TaxID=183556 RepID=UPI0022B5B917|nr:hypothetical protein [Rhodococcus maanshanensis]MCZ4557982.1 hypothetical protein [Rhodococcus maanshanensis]